MVMTMKATTAIALLAALMMTSCSSSDTESVGSGQEVADMIGCTGWSNTSEDDTFVREGGTCQLNGQEVGVYYFLDDMARNGYVEEGSAMGGNYLVGDGWVIEAPSAVLDQLEAEHGGARSFG